MCLLGCAVETRGVLEKWTDIEEQLLNGVKNVFPWKRNLIKFN